MLIGLLQRKLDVGRQTLVCTHRQVDIGMSTQVGRHWYVHIGRETLVCTQRQVESGRWVEIGRREDWGWRKTGRDRGGVREGRNQPSRITSARLDYTNKLFQRLIQSYILPQPSWCWGIFPGFWLPTCLSLMTRSKWYPNSLRPKRCALE